MLKEIKERYKDSFPAGCTAQLENMETNLLHYLHFSSEDALELGTEIIRQAKSYGEDIAVRIIRCQDSLVIFQYIGSSLAERNLTFAMAKYNTVIKTGHCSLWALAQEETEGGMEEVFSENSEYLPAGGAFPAFVGSTMAAVITTSGLHYGKDHEVVVKALCKLQSKPMPAFDGVLA